MQKKKKIIFLVQKSSEHKVVSNRSNSGYRMDLYDNVYVLALDTSNIENRKNKKHEYHIIILIKMIPIKESPPSRMPLRYHERLEAWMDMKVCL